MRTSWRGALRGWRGPKAVPQAPPPPPPDAADLAATFAGPLLDRCAAAEVALLDEPHILVCTDPATGVTTYTGPFPNAYEALVGLPEVEAALRTVDDLPGPTCTPAPLFPG